MADDTADLEGDELVVHLLQQTAVRASVTLKSLGMTQTDKTASRDIVDAKRSIAGASVVKVSRLPGADEHHRAICAAQARGRQALLDRSMPFGDDKGWRLLPNRHLTAVMQEFGQAKKDHEEAHERFLDDVINVLAKAQANLGDFDVELPTEEEIRNAYTMKIEFHEIPNGRYSGLDEALTKRLQAHTQSRVAAAFAQGQAEVLPRILEPVAAFVERMQAYTERERKLLNGESVDKGKSGQFRNAVVENLKPVAAALRDCNLIGNPRLESLAARVAALAQTDPGLLRSDPGTREKSRSEAQAVLDSIKDWSG